MRSKLDRLKNLSYAANRLLPPSRSTKIPPQADRLIETIWANAGHAVSFYPIAAFISRF
jgi:hypothetical protein